jgi:hypothetical protein
MPILIKSVLDLINNNVCLHLKNYNRINLYSVKFDSLSLVSSFDKHKINYEFSFQNIDFAIQILYDQGIISESLNFKSNYAFTDQLDEINNFHNHFKSNQHQPLCELFTLLNSAV